MSEALPSEQRFNAVERLNTGGVYAALDGDRYLTVHDYSGVDGLCLDMQDARDLRDWLNKVLP